MTALLSWLPVTSFALAIVSALLPWFNAEVLLLAASSAVASRTELVFVVLAITLGQVVGKIAMYWGARSATGRPTPRVDAFLERWRVRFDARPQAAPLVIFVSATVGLPPLYLVTIAAGALRVGFWPYLAASGIGRLLHFGAIGLLPAFYWVH
jgi:membrane protein YqaA with SNARE-associated domain